ncbi:tape measure protein [Ureibacillus thermophilus]|uniref:Tape measure protein N-terminal domain-containing protein n=1 Tax=Ureibacillus thermophilus TaxID=367743 RepID=A0A4P6UV89_9BACL|nr:tape measure protein [Ureibacillus thermophilus]QBK26747.1 hypothetical protein DKZ56_13350 [Ureibacillus thermophilus]
MTTIKTSIMVHDMMSQQFRAMNMAMATVIDSFQTLQDLSGKAVDVSALEAAQRELQQVEANFNQIENEIRQAENAQNEFNKSVQNSDNYAKKLLGTIGSIVGTYLTLNAIGDAISISDEIANSKARLELMNDGLQTTAELQNMIYHSAQRSYSSYSDMVDIVGKLGNNARDAFESTAEVVAFAELLQKQFSIAGTEATEAANASLQLTQALGSGVLRGDELNSIFEQAPTIIQTIADYLDVPIGKIREMAADGEITAEIVKSAMFAAADDINKKFESMPLTFGQIWTSFKNEALWAFQDVLAYMNEIANSEKFQEFVNRASQSLYVIAQLTLTFLHGLASLGAFVYDNWAIIEPVLTIVGSALLALAAYFTIAKIAAMEFTFAQWNLNAAMAANPIGVIIGALILLIGLYFAAIEVVNHFTGANISAVGLITGAFAFMYSVFYNVIAYMLNLVVSFAEFWINIWRNPVYTIKRFFANLANSAIDMATSMIGSFDSVATNLANMLIAAANKAIEGINWIIGALNQIPGLDIGKVGKFSARTSIKADYSGLKKRINDWVGDMPETYIELPRLEYMSPLDNAVNAYNWGANLFSGFDLDIQNQESFNMEKYMKDILNSVNGLGDAIDAGNGSAKDTAGNTGKLADSVDLLEEDMKYLRDAANAEAINRYTTGNITIDMSGMQNNINSELDLDGIVDKLVAKTEEALDALPEGV